MAIKQLDSLIVEPLTKWMEEQDMDYRLLMLSDHKTLMSSRTHDGDPVPYLLYDSQNPVGCGRTYCEASGEQGPFVQKGTDLMNLLFEKI